MSRSQEWGARPSALAHLGTHPSAPVWPSVGHTHHMSQLQGGQDREQGKWSFSGNP